jgi:hypothetical protein
MGVCLSHQEIINAAKGISTPIITCTLQDEYNEAWRKASEKRRSYV